MWIACFPAESKTRYIMNEISNRYTSCDAQLYLNISTKIYLDFYVKFQSEWGDET